MNNVRAVVTASSAVPLGTGVAALPAAALAHVANRPLLHHVVLGLARAGVAEATLVADADTLPALQAALVEHRVRGVAMRHVERRRDASLLAAVLAAERGEDDATVVVVPAGSLCTFPVSALLQRQHDERLDALLTLPPGRDGREAAPGPPLVLGPQALRSLAGGGDLEGDALRVGHLPVPLPLDGSGGPDALLALNRHVLDELEASWASMRAATAGVTLTGRVRVHPTARVEGSTILGPVIIGAHAEIVDAYIGPYTSIGDHVVVRGAEVEGSVLLTGAEIRHLGSRLEGSVVGVGAQLSRDFRLPRSLRLHVGEGARVQMA